MGCCGPNNLGAGATTPESCKRVNYTLGMLLGVDDFVQESAYHGARRRELAREVLGYGTVHGLQVIVEADGDKGPRVRVMPGMAWLPSGTPVCVDSPQCANLNDWLAAHAGEVDAALAGSPAPESPFTLYAVLSYAQCLTDNVPIPGEPCRDESELMQPSRVADGFRLELRLAPPPPQREEDAVRDFVEWLVRLPLAVASPPLGEAEFIEQLREAARDWLAPTSPPASPSDYMLGSAPAGTSEALFRAALRLWTTELRPLWMARADCGCKAASIPTYDDAVLLAELRVDLVPTSGSGGWRVSDTGPAVEIDEGRRPVLLSLRMVQELIAHHPSPDPGNAVLAETAFDLVPDAGVSLAYARADHTHGSPVLPELGGDLSGPIAAAHVESLQGVPLVAASPLVEGQVLTFEGGQWVPRAPELPELPPPPSLVGDVVGPPGGNQITALQGRTLNAPNPIANQVLRFVGGQWQAADLPEPPPLGGEFVDRGDRERRYQIVAAAEFDLLLRLGGRRVPVLRHHYGQIEGVSAIVDSQQPQRAVIRLRVKVPDAQKFLGHIVKLTPVWTEVTPFSFQLYLLEEVIAEGDELIEFRVLLLAEKQIAEGAELPFRFQVELSRFEEEPR